MDTRHTVIDPGLAWLDAFCEPGYRVTFAHRVAPRELLTRMGADPATFRRRDAAAAEQAQAQLAWGLSVARAGLHEGWAYAVESTGGHGSGRETLRRVSCGTRALALLRAADGGWGFVLAEEGEVVATRESVSAGRGAGALGDWPWRVGLLGLLAEEPASGQGAGVGARLLALADGALGARLPREQVEWGWLVSAEVGDVCPPAAPVGIGPGVPAPARGRPQGVGAGPGPGVVTGPEGAAS
ncbi:hypothetical protein FH609_015470 [Streptomyces sp. 3MP-14]|uniref:Uncharacterized protein n=1 Tax=Streptomyces mimosae TaxID=2586635 RepID=A0A5N6ADE1_9ACTN|nr:MULTISPECIES: DUF6461 domain-containing protein [Streptomyces]KAB8165800.1 hypothetical protein FH607_012795 [Streptomyces mimosae]KAB8176189.1 hypothetical protein FH609_015470 [Streptomyces sp. 3MP-14]